MMTLDPSEITKLREQVAAQAAVIETIRAHLKVIAGLQLCADNLMSNSDIAAKALAIPTDSTQILAEVRRAEREKCAKVCDRLSRKEKAIAADYGFGYLTYTADDCAAAIRSME